MALKDYVEVSDRVKEFRSNEKYKGWSLRTDIIEHNNGMIVMKAVVRDESDRIISEGTAYEVNEAQGKNLINLTSYIENCETSAVGRALGFIGIGIDKSIASKDEVDRAVKQQEKYISNNETQSKTGDKVERYTGKVPGDLYYKQFPFDFDEGSGEYQISYDKNSKNWSWKIKQIISGNPPKEFETDLI